MWTFNRGSSTRSCSFDCTAAESELFTDTVRRRRARPKSIVLVDLPRLAKHSLVTMIGTVRGTHRNTWSTTIQGGSGVPEPGKVARKSDGWFWRRACSVEGRVRHRNNDILDKGIPYPLMNILSYSLRQYELAGPVQYWPKGVKCCMA